MKIKISPARVFYVLTTSAIVFSSCQKNETASTTTSVESASETIAVAASISNETTSSGTAVDSVYLLQACVKGGRRDSIAVSSLPASISDYLATNYSGYTFYKAFAIKNASSEITGYVVVIYFNDNQLACSLMPTEIS